MCGVGTLGRAGVALFATIALTGCAALPAATPLPAELPRLELRARNSPADAESVLRLAAGEWAQGDRGGALRTLAAARAAAPGVPLYAAAIGAASEGEGLYPEAREAYLAFLSEAPMSELSPTIVERVSVVRGETAAPLVDALRAAGIALDHGHDPALVVAVLPFRAAEGGGVSAAIAAAATELLTLDLRDRQLEVLDWELGAAAARSLAVSGDAPGSAQRIGALLGARRLVWGEVREEGNSISIHLQVLLPDRSGSAVLVADSVALGRDTYAIERARVANRAWELLLGARARSSPFPTFVSGPSSSWAALQLLGEGILALEAGDRRAASAAWERARALAPRFSPLAERLTQLHSLEAMRTSSTLPMADALLDWVRRETSMADLWRSATGGALAASPLSRHGVAEAFGVDRLGAQVFTEFVLTIEGEGP